MKDALQITVQITQADALPRRYIGAYAYFLLVPGNDKFNFEFKGCKDVDGKELEPPNKLELAAIILAAKTKDLTFKTFGVARLEAGNDPKPVPTPDPAPKPQQGDDIAIITRMRWYRGHISKTPMPVDALKSVRWLSERNMIEMTFGPAAGAKGQKLCIIQKRRDGSYHGGSFDEISPGNRRKDLSNINGGPPASNDGNIMRPYVVDFNLPTGFFWTSPSGDKVSKICWMNK